MNSSPKNLTFLFYHYGKIPRYLCNAVEHVRIYNPEAEIMLITDGIRDTSKLKPFNVRHHEMTAFPSIALDAFRQTYRHISCFKERYERFVLERWFVTETIRRQRTDRVYIMQDSDVAVFGDASKLLPLMPDCPIALSSNNPHFTFVRDDISSFLHFILDFYASEERMNNCLKRYEEERNSPQIYTMGEMQFLYEFMQASSDMQKFPTDTPGGYIDVNLHIPEGFDFMQLRRRPRKKIFWRYEEGKVVPYFRKNGKLNRAFLVHFQGPGKRVFFRFNRFPWANNSMGLAILNTMFQHKGVANIT
jgi:hypothetical protein